MDEYGIRAVGSSIDKLVQMLDRQTRELHETLSPLKELPTLTRDTQQAVQQGLSDLQGIIVQLRLAEIGTQVDAYEGMAEAEREALREKVDELAGDVERISDRYRKLLDDIARSTEASVRELDEPVLALLEDFYPRIVEARYADRLLPGRRAVVTQAERTAAVRAGALNDSIEKLSRAVLQFVEAREEGTRVLNRFARTRPEKPLERWVGLEVIRHRADVHVDAALPEESAGEALAERFRELMDDGEVPLTARTGTAAAAHLRGTLLSIANRWQHSDPAKARTARFLADAVNSGAIRMLEVET